MDPQTQISDIQDMDKLRTYKLLKLNFGCKEFMFVMLSCTSVCWCLVVTCWERADLSALVLWCLVVTLSLSQWYPGSSVVLVCIYSWSLPSFLRCTCILNKMYRTAYSRFRGSLFSFACSEGRYNITPFVERICPLWKNGIETEFHFFLECQNFSQIRSKIDLQKSIDFLLNPFFVFQMICMWISCIICTHGVNKMK